MNAQVEQLRYENQFLAKESIAKENLSKDLGKQLEEQLKIFRSVRRKI